MNIFFLSMNPKIAAEWHCDKHVVKMLLESTQLLWTAQHIIAQEAGISLELTDAPTTKDGSRRGYKPTHKNHPCAIWVRKSLANYMWLCALAAALTDEYHYRYPAAGPHACEEHVAWLTANPPRLPEGPLTRPEPAMRPEYKINANPTACYRAFYVGSKGARGLLTYTRRALPTWIASN